jgi:hypothetical protein
VPRPHGLDSFTKGIEQIAWSVTANSWPKTPILESFISCMHAVTRSRQSSDLVLGHPGGAT